MKYIISGKNMTVKEGLKERIEEKLSKLDKFFSEDTKVQVTLSTEKRDSIIEVTIPIRGSVIRSEERGETMYIALDNAVDKLERQMVKHRKKLVDGHRQAKELRIDYFEQISAEPEDTINIERTKKISVKPMDPEEACLQMDLLGHDFYVFRNRYTNDVNVVYKRKNSGYGLIETDGEEEE